MCGSTCTTASPAGRVAITWISTRQSVAKASTKRLSTFARNFIAPFLGFNRSAKSQNILPLPADTGLGLAARHFRWRASGANAQSHHFDSGAKLQNSLARQRQLGPSLSAKVAPFQSAIDTLRPGKAIKARGVL